MVIEEIRKRKYLVFRSPVRRKEIRKISTVESMTRRHEERLGKFY